MIIDGLRYRDITDAGPTLRAVFSFLEFIERKLGVTILYDRRRLPYGRDDLREPMRIAARLLENGIIKQWGRTSGVPDEVPLKLWWCELEPGDRNNAGGGSYKDSVAALYSALAESLERYLWYKERDCFIKPRRASTFEMQEYVHVAPERFSAFSAAQRNEIERLRLRDDSKFLWIQGTSLVSGKQTYIPAQTVSAAWQPRSVTPQEPIIRSQVTTGLATWSTRKGAQLRGALECVERDAYMIWWLNQLDLPRADMKKLRAKSETLDQLVAHCEQYRLRIHTIPLLTDAPAHAVCVIAEDISAVGPRFAFGLKAHRSLTRAVEGAILEALRARRFTRAGDPAEHYDPSKGIDAIGHRGRVHYWEIPENAVFFEKYIESEAGEAVEAPWENDSEEEHLARIVGWCREKGYEFVSVPLGISKKNPTPWHVESVAIPELVPTHLNENLRHLGGPRLKSIPESFGYTARAEPYTERPHPFC